MSAPPVIVCASSTSGIVRRCDATGSWPPLTPEPTPAPCAISSVANADTGKPSAVGSTDGAQPVITPARSSRSSRACTVPRATPSRRDASSTPMRGSSGKQCNDLAV